MTKTNMDTIQVEPVWSHKMNIVKYSSFFFIASSKQPWNSIAHRSFPTYFQAIFVLREKVL